MDGPESLYVGLACRTEMGPKQALSPSFLETSIARYENG